MTAKAVYVVDGARTPFLKSKNRPGPFAASDLATQAGRTLLARQKFALDELDEVILGCAAPSVDEVNIGRVAALRMGCGQQVPGWTVMRNCASGMQAVDSGISNILAGRSELVLAGGVDALSRAPLLYADKMVLWFSEMAVSKTAFQKTALFAKLPVKALLAPVIGIMKGLTDPMVGLLMGQTAENVAHRFGITREQMDAFSGRSHQRGACGDTDPEAPRARVERPRLLGDQRGLRRAGARLPRGLEGRQVLPRGARPRRRHGRAGPRAAERRRRRHRPRPPGGSLRRENRLASVENAQTHGLEARHGIDLHRRRPRRSDAGRSAVRGEDMDRARLTKHWHWETDRDGLAWLTFDKQGESANTFSREALEQLSAALEEIRRADPKGLVIRSAKEGFIAGADVEEFTRFKSLAEAMSFVRLGWDVFQALRELPFPTTAMVNGFCMGGGVELALACRYRVALDDPKTRFALPEAMLGIMPAWHGVQWLPKLVGPAAAFDMLLTGKSVDARRAQRIGLVDQAVPLRILENTARIITLESPKRKRL